MYYVYGLHAVLAALQNKNKKILRLFILQNKQDKKIKDLLIFADQHNIPIEMTSRKYLDQLVQSTHHQGLVAECAKNQAYLEKDLPLLLESLEQPLILILDGVQDPHNLGACLRTAEAFGVDGVIVPKDRSVGITATVSKVASGAVESVPFFQVTNLARTMRVLKEHRMWIYGAASEANQSLYLQDFAGPLALVLGGEQSGLRHLTRELCDGLVSIPMYGSVSSLNVSVATGVMLYEATRQRNKNI